VHLQLGHILASDAVRPRKPQRDPVVYFLVIFRIAQTRSSSPPWRRQVAGQCVKRISGLRSA
jgi:hypothetical protein